MRSSGRHRDFVKNMRYFGIASASATCSQCRRSSQRQVAGDDTRVTEEFLAINLFEDYPPNGELSFRGGVAGALGGWRPGDPTRFLLPRFKQRFATRTVRPRRWRGSPLRQPEGRRPTDRNKAGVACRAHRMMLDRIAALDRRSRVTHRVARGCCAFIEHSCRSLEHGVCNGRCRRRRSCHRFSPADGRKRDSPARKAVEQKWVADRVFLPARSRYIGWSAVARKANARKNS